MSNTAEKKTAPNASANNHGMEFGEVAHRTRGQDIWRQFRRHKGAMISLFVLAFLFALLIFAQFYYDFDTDICAITVNVLRPCSAEHPLGTDHLGRDVLARLLYGGRWSISLAASSVFISTFIGVVYGAIATYIGGWIEDLMMRIAEALMMVPSMLMVIVLVGVLGVSTVNLIVAMSIGGIPWLARLTRAIMMPIRDVDYVEAAKAIGVSDARILFTHILPNCMSPLIVNVTTRIGGAIIGVASYSFIGLGVPKPIPEWGTMLSEAKDYITIRPEMIWYPGIIILVYTLAFNLLGDGLRDALDPKLKR